MAVFKGGNASLSCDEETKIFAIRFTTICLHRCCFLLPLPAEADAAANAVDVAVAAAVVS